MNKLCVGICSMVMMCGTVHAGLVDDTVKLEEQYDVADNNMYTMIYADDMQRYFNETCTPQDLAEAKQYEVLIKEIFEKNRLYAKQAKILDDTTDRYKDLNEYHEDVQRYRPGMYCSLQYILYGIQDYLRERHIVILTETEIIKDFDGYQNELYGYEVKRDLLAGMIADAKRYENKLGSKLTISTFPSAFEDSLKGDEKQLQLQIKELLKYSLYKALYNLKSAGTLDQADINLIANKIEFETVDSCDVFHGRYEIRETLTSEGEHVSYTTDRMLLKVNYCSNYFVLQELDTVFAKIITHELGHHYYFYHDEGRDEFEALCWTDSGKRKGECESTDFVSEYAMSSSQEDYAETFMYIQRDLLPDDITQILENKVEHFVTLEET